MEMGQKWSKRKNRKGRKKREEVAGEEAVLEVEIAPIEARRNQKN